jgi:hypothetical protein
MNIRSIFGALRSGVVKHSPEILTAVGTIGLIAAGVMAVNQTPKAVKILEDYSNDVSVEEPITPQEKFKMCWKLYLPSVLMATTSVASIIFARRIDSKRMAAWAAAYQMSETAINRLEQSIKDEYGERKLKKLEQQSDLKLLEENPINPDEIVNTGDGDDLFCDYYSGGYFRSTPEAVRARYNHWIAKLQRNDSMSVNSWVTELELRPMGDDVGEEMGFTSSMYQNRELDDEPIFEYGPGYLGKPCAVVKLSCRPTVDYKYNY